MFGSFDDALDFVYSTFLNKRNIKGGIDVARHPEFILDLMKILKISLPENVIVVSGSKGKGTTAVLTASALSSQGIRVGLFTGPHLVTQTERIRIDGKAITKDRFLEIINEIAPYVKKMDDLLPRGTWLWAVSIWLIVGMKYFEENNIDTVVLEGGRGALFDESSAIPHRVSVLGPIFYEHYDQLGPTMDDIAKNKAGIVRDNGILVSANQQQDVYNILIDRCNLYGAKMLMCDRDFTVETKEDGSFSVRTPMSLYENLRIPLYGSYQPFNAASALVAAESLLSRTIGHPYAWRNLKWPGRLQLINHNGTQFLIDGAIAENSVKAVSDFIARLNTATVATIVSVSKDKDYRGVIKEAAVFSDCIIITEANNPQMHFPDDALEYAKTVAPKKSVEFHKTLDVAISRAIELCPNSLIAILGTQSIIGDAMKYFGINISDIY